MSEGTSSKRQRSSPSEEVESQGNSQKRSRLTESGGLEASQSGTANHHERKAHKLTEEFVELSSRILYEGNGNGTWSSYGYDAGQYPLEAVSGLGFLTSPLRRPSIMETWSPYQVALFEAAIYQYGKDFFTIQKQIDGKSTQQVIDFYYIWKKTVHYQKWKRQYVSPHLDVSSDDEPDDKEQTTKPSSSNAETTPKR